MRGFTAYAETISVYGTETYLLMVMIHLGLKDSSHLLMHLVVLKCASPLVQVLEVQMGQAEGKSMLYLEIRCLYITKGAGVQGIKMAL